MRKSDDPNPHYPLVQEFAAGRPFAKSEATWTKHARVLDLVLRLGVRAKMSPDSLYGLGSPDFLRGVMVSVNPTRAAFIRESWPDIRSYYAATHNLELPALVFKRGRGRPPRYPQQFFDAVRVLSAIRVSVSRLCNLRWGDIVETNQEVTFRFGQDSSTTVDRGPEIDTAIADIRAWSAKSHGCAVSALVDSWPVVPSSADHRIRAHPQSVRLAMSRSSDVSRVEAAEEGEAEEEAAD